LILPHVAPHVTGLRGRSSMRFSLHHVSSSVTCANTFVRIAVFLGFPIKWREVE
jgi:hypothetical protein